MSAPAGLPRSLVPLDDESLPGYLLRLSYRLEIAPTRLADLTGLARTSERISVRHLLQLAPAATSTLARVCSISQADAQTLSLGGFGAVYPQAHRFMAQVPAPWNSADGTAPWVMTNFSRYCPQCLAGDRTPIQQALGGAWRRAWRLPVVFACIRHHRFLEHTCPACANPALSFGPRRDGRLVSFGLLPAPHTISHPTQCRARLHPTTHRERTELCAARLDSREPSSAPHPTSDLINLQKRLLERLSHESDAPGVQARATAYFADLNTALLLMTASWPHAATLLPNSPHLHATDSHISNLSRMRTGPSANAPRTALLDALPRASAPCASVLAVADALLALPDLEAHLTDLAAHAHLPTPALAKLARLHRPCSQAVQAAIDPWTAVLDRNTYSGRPSFPRLGEQPIGFERRHVPQRLPEAWLTSLGIPEGLHHDIPRRAAAIALVLLSGGGSHAGAGEYLELSPSAATSLGQRISHWKRSGHNARDFLDAVRHLVSFLNNPDNQIDYEHRRDQLRDWHIPEADWQLITDEIERHQSARASRRAAWNEAKHLAATVAIWAHVTDSEPRYAPALARVRHAGPIPSPTSPLIKALLSPEVSPKTQYVDRLKSMLTNYASNLAASIDAAAPNRAR